MEIGQESFTVSEEKCPENQTMDVDEESDGDKGKTNDVEFERETLSSSSSTSDSSSEEEESEEEKNEVEDDDDEDDSLQRKEPIRSKNEVKELPPVPSVDVTLEPHHATIPVGVVQSVMDTQVIVAGIEKHSPLNEGSILWITERRRPLGLVDEIFGTVKCPFYKVRFNSESEIPEGISQGTSISYVAEFADIVNIEELQKKKGYDVSGRDDEEISDEVEFSDDEKEAEYKRMKKIPKRKMKHRPRPQMDGGAWRPQSNQQYYPYQPPNQMGIANSAPIQNQMMFQPGQQTSYVAHNGLNQQPYGMGSGIQHPQSPNYLFTSQGTQMQRPQSQMYWQQSQVNPQFQLQPQYQTPPQRYFLQSPMQPQSQRQWQFYEQGRGYHGRR